VDEGAEEPEEEVDEDEDPGDETEDPPIIYFLCLKSRIYCLK